MASPSGSVDTVELVHRVIRVDRRSGGLAGRGRLFVLGQVAVGVIDVGRDVAQRIGRAGFPVQGVEAKGRRVVPLVGDLDDVALAVVGEFLGRAVGVHDCREAVLAVVEIGRRIIIGV